MLQSKLSLIIITVLFFGVARLNAQDGHYWSQQYGTTSTLLGGVVIGSVEDLDQINDMR